MNKLLQTYQKPLLKVGSVLLVLLFWCLIWWLGSWCYGDSYLVPSPFVVFPKFASLLGTKVFWLSVKNTCISILLGYVMGCLIGFFAGWLTAKSKIANALFTPLFSMIRATPVACFVIIAWLILGSERLPVFITMLMAAPVMMTNVSAGVTATPKDLLESARIYRLSFWDKVRVCYLPAMAPHISSGLVTAFGLAWKSGIATEIITQLSTTLGYAVYEEKSLNYSMSGMLAWTLAIILLELVLEALLKVILLIPRYIRRYRHAHAQ